MTHNLGLNNILTVYTYNRDTTMSTFTPYPDHADHAMYFQFEEDEYLDNDFAYEVDDEDDELFDEDDGLYYEDDEEYFDDDFYSDDLEDY